MKMTLRGAFCALILTLSLTFSSCNKETAPASASFEAMDTVMSLTVYGGDNDACDALQSRIAALDEQLDATDENSEIFRLNTDKQAALGEDAAALLRASLSLCEQLDGAFDITVYPAVQAWGFTTGDYRVPDDSELAALAGMIDYRAVQSDGDTFTLSDQTQIDLGAVAKGYAADICKDILREHNADAAVLNLGGTVCLYGAKPDGSRFKVGVADPDNPAAFFGTLTCDACVVATSGGYERYFEQDGRRYIHILDPQTAAPVDNGLQSVTVVCDSGAKADALSTALFVMGRDKAIAYYQAHPDFDCILLTDEGELTITAGIYDDFTLSDGCDFTLRPIG